MALMRAEEVIVSDPEGKVIAGAVDVVKTVCMAVRSLISAVQPFNHLFEWPVLCRNSIVVGKSDDLCDFEGESFVKFFGKLHCGKWIGTVAVSGGLKVFQQFCKAPVSLPYAWQGYRSRHHGCRISGTR